MRLAVKDSLTEQEIEFGPSAVIKDGMASTDMATLTGGAFLVAFALKLGASNLGIGLMVAISPQAKMGRYSITENERNGIRSQTLVFGEHLAWI
jgi:predicted phage tail protein